MKKSFIALVALGLAAIGGFYFLHRGVSVEIADYQIEKAIRESPVKYETIFFTVRMVNPSVVFDEETINLKLNLLINSDLPYLKGLFTAVGSFETKMDYRDGGFYLVDMAPTGLKIQNKGKDVIDSKTALLFYDAVSDGVQLMLERYPVYRLDATKKGKAARMVIKDIEILDNKLNIRLGI